MKKITSSQRELIAEFFANIGVAWFAGGVIGVFVTRTDNVITIIGSFTWGIFLSLLSLWSGVLLLKRGK